jgi:glycosyltransferase involved in cell wall biosynthesis
MNKLFHVINFSSRNEWIEHLLSTNFEKDYADCLIILGNQGPLVDYLKKISPDMDIVFVKDPSSFLNLLLHLRAEVNGNKLMLNSHGHSASIFSLLVKIFSKIPFVVSHHQQPNFFHYFFKKRPLQSFVHSLVYFAYCRLANHIFAYSKEVRNKLKLFRVSNQKVSLLPLGINILNFHFLNHSQFNHKKLQILVVSRLSWEKRIDLSILVARALLNLGTSLSLNIVGAGPEESSLKKFVKDLSLDDVVAFSGTTSEIQSIFNSSDLLLHMSQTESYGQVILEALLCGVPVFSSPVGVALDIESMDEPLLEICRATEPTVIAAQISTFLDSLVDLRARHQQLPLPQDVYSKHDLSVCHREFALIIASEFSKI